MLGEWAVPSGSPRKHRDRVATSRGSTFSAEHARACRYLAEIELWIQRLRARNVNVSGFEATYTAWQEAVFSVQLPWLSAVGSATPAIGNAQLHLLTSLGAAIDLAGGAVEISPATIGAVEEIIAKAEEFVHQSAGIPESLRLHLLGLLAEIRECVNSGRADRAATLVSEFIGTVDLTAERVPEDEKSNWRGLAHDWVVQFSANVAAAGTLPLLAAGWQAAQLAIGS